MTCDRALWLRLGIVGCSLLCEESQLFVEQQYPWDLPLELNMAARVQGTAVSSPIARDGLFLGSAGREFHEPSAPTAEQVPLQNGGLF
jgi:hypothetical protein